MQVWEWWKDSLTQNENHKGSEGKTIEMNEISKKKMQKRRCKWSEGPIKVLKQEKEVEVWKWWKESLT